MKKVVSVSLGSSDRDHETEVRILGKNVHIQRVGVDGDFDRAAKLFRELDNRVDVLSLGGAEFGINFENRYFPLRAVSPLIANLATPVVDGSAVRGVVERNLASFLCERLGNEIPRKRVFFCVSTARWDLVLGFHDAGFDKLFGDPGFVAGIPFTATQFWLARLTGHICLPFVVRLPFKWLYPTGKQQHINRPKFKKWFDWTDVIADDFHYIKRHLPERIDGKIIVTNTTTDQDRQMLRQSRSKIRRHFHTDACRKNLRYKCF